MEVISKEEALKLVEKTGREKVKKSGELSVESIEKEIEGVSEKQTWHEDNLRKIEELGMEMGDVARLAIESVKYPG